MAKIRIFTGKDARNHRRMNDVPQMMLYYAPGEETSWQPNETIELLRAESVVTKERIAMRNPAIPGEYSFVIQLSTIAASLLAAWLAGRRGRKIEIQKGDMKVSAPALKKLEAALALLKRHRKVRVLVRKPKPKKPTKSRE